MVIKGPFCRPPHLQACFPPPTTTKNKTAYTCIFTGYHSRPTDELDTLSDSSSLPNSARLMIPHAPTRGRLKKKKKKKKRLCIVFELFCLVNNFMIWKRKKKEEKNSNGGGRIWTRNLRFTKLAHYHWTTETYYIPWPYKICIYIQYGLSDQTTFDLCNPTMPILIEKILLNA